MFLQPVKIINVLLLGKTYISEQYPVVNVNAVKLDVGRLGGDVAVADAFVFAAGVKTVKVENAFAPCYRMSVIKADNILLNAAYIFKADLSYFRVKVVVL